MPCQEGKWPKNEAEVDNGKSPEIFCQKVRISANFCAFLRIFEKSLFRIQVLIIAALIKILVKSLKNQVSNLSFALRINCPMRLVRRQNRLGGNV